MSLNGRVALVTGGSSGIGEAVCRALAAQGTAVVVASRRIEAAQKVVQALPGDAKHCAMHVDVGDTSSVENLFGKIRASFTQPLSIVVNTAGEVSLTPIADCSDDVFDEIIRTRLKGAFAVIRAASREMFRWCEKLPQGGGAIVNISGTAAAVCDAHFGACAASKAGAEVLTKAAAKELAPHGIRCNTVMPGWTDTPLTAAVDKHYRHAYISKTPLKRAAKPEEIAEVVVFLCSPKSSSYITGARLVVSGGVYM